MPAVSGTVKDANGNFARRLVRVHRRDTGALVGETLSHPTTGAWSVTTADTSKHYAVAHDSDAWITYLPFNGDNGSTSFPEWGGKTVTAYGDAQISTAQSKFGGSSAKFGGNGDYLSIPASANFNFGTGDFTIEAFVFIAANSSLDGSNRRYAHIVAIDDGFYEPLSFFITGDATNTGTGLGIWNGTNSALVSGAVSQSAWHHIAVCRASGSIMFFLDGVQVGSPSSYNYSLGGSNHPAKIGGRPWSKNYNYYLNGYIDDLRITKGVARYTANFTPPVAAFLDQLLTFGQKNAMIYDHLTPV